MKLDNEWYWVWAFSNTHNWFNHQFMVFVVFALTLYKYCWLTECSLCICETTVFLAFEKTAYFQKSMQGGILVPAYMNQSDICDGKEVFTNKFKRFILSFTAEYKCSRTQLTSNSQLYKHTCEMWSFSSSLGAKTVS